MGAFLASIIVVVGLSFGAMFGLETIQRYADSAYLGSGARPDPDPRLQPPKPAPKS